MKILQQQYEKRRHLTVYQILIAEDDQPLNRGISLALKGPDKEIHSVFDLASASAKVKASSST